MLVSDAQREVRTVYVGGFWGQLVSGAIWLTSAALGTWATPRAAIIAIVAGGFFIFPLTQLMLRLSGRQASLTSDNPLKALAVQIAFTLPLGMLLLAPVGAYRLNWFYPALMILVGSGTLIAMYFAESFSLGAWVGGGTLLVFAWVGRAAVRAEMRSGN